MIINGDPLGDFLQDLIMNGFTKEDLQYIYDGLGMLSKLGWEKSDLTFCKKIAGMIDDYCDHKDNHNCYERLAVCSKCDNPK